MAGKLILNESESLSVAGNCIAIVLWEECSRNIKATLLWFLSARLNSTSCIGGENIVALVMAFYKAHGAQQGHVT